jgi:uncharacterized membrane protein YgdD (TMEM256/DUF423 family)
MKNNVSGWAAILGAVAVMIGAFGAHGLKPHLTEYQISIFEKGVQYHFYHVPALLLTGVWRQVRTDTRFMKWAGYLFIAGIACFSGSLYLLACRDILPFSVSWAGPLTPIGGLCFITGWLLTAREMFR